MLSLEHVDGSTTTAEAVSSILERDGAAIVEQAIGAEILDGLNSDLDGFVDELGVGLRNPTSDHMVQFYGSSTVRFDGLAAKSPSALAAIRRTVTLGGGMTFDDGLAYELETVVELAGTPDFAEGVDAFLAKREPK